MALGERIGESSGRITGTRVVSSIEGDVQIEITFQGSGMMLGEHITDLGTYLQTVRPGGVLYGEGDVLFITTGGESAHWSGFGVGRPTGPFPAGHMAVCGSVQTESERLMRLNSVATAVEYDVEQDGSYRWTAWAWI